MQFSNSGCVNLLNNFNRIDVQLYKILGKLVWKFENRSFFDVRTDEVENKSPLNTVQDTENNTSPNSEAINGNCDRDTLIRSKSAESSVATGLSESAAEISTRSESVMQSVSSITFTDYKLLELRAFYTNLKIVDPKTYRRHCYDFCITNDFKLVCVNYPKNQFCEYGSTHEVEECTRIQHEQYDSFFDILDKYKIVEKIIVQDDGLSDLPHNFSKFENLKELVVMGSRFFKLTMENMPKNIEILDLTHQSNLYDRFTESMEDMKKLRTISFISDVGNFESALFYGVYEFFTDDDEFFTDGNNSCLTSKYGRDTVPFADLDSLRHIRIVFGGSISGRRKRNWREVIKYHTMFKKIRYRIKHINIKDENDRKYYRYNIPVINVYLTGKPTKLS